MDNHLIDQIRQANDIVDVIQSYVPLKHVGSNWRGICPFHQDTKPSMYVSQPKQIFKCFACGKAGNAITFVQDYEKLTFIEAVKKLAQRVGIKVPEREQTTVVSTKRQQLLSVYKSAGLFFSESLFKYGDSVLEYLSKRQISPETAKELQLGYALASEKALLNHLMKEGYGVSLLKESGLFGFYNGALTDMFRDRLMFPIHNNTGDVIAFGGRIMQPKDNVGKYLNSPGTELYTKGKELYGLAKTKYNISKSNYALVCEGYFDFLRLYESGFNNSVASLGTALTEDQVFLLNRFAKKAYMLYDGDNAGVKAAVRGGLNCLSKGLEVYVVSFPEGEDPDSFLIKNGNDALNELIATAPDLISFLATNKRVEYLTKERIEMVLDALRSMTDQIQRELLLNDLAAKFSISRGALTNSLRRTNSYNQETTTVKTSPTPVTQNRDERNILILALKDIESYKMLASELNADYFVGKLYKRIFAFLGDNLQYDREIDAAALMDKIDNSEIKDSLAELLFEDIQLLNLESMIRDLKLRKIKRDLEAIDVQIAADPDNLELRQQRDSLNSLYCSMTKKVIKNRLQEAKA